MTSLLFIRSKLGTFDFAFPDIVCDSNCGCPMLVLMFGVVVSIGSSYKFLNDPLAVAYSVFCLALCF